jgi:hypothetical protein
MLLKLNTKTRQIEKTKKIKLFDIGWKEEDLQTLLYDNLDKLFPDEELLLIMQSKKGQEQPDLLAVDAEGTLYIFELKAWESQDFNLLQALRYGQIYGQKSYDLLNQIYKYNVPKAQDLLSAINEKFNVDLKSFDINKKQKFIVITNGLDYKTRTATKYWNTLGINIQNWIYRIHELGEQHLIEFDKLKLSEDPLEDIGELSYVLNTNIRNSVDDEKDMIDNSKAAAFFSPWKHKIESLKNGDKVFLYSSGTGIIAMGIATGKVEKKNYHGENEYVEEEYFQKLKEFRKLTVPISPSEIKSIGGRNYVFMQTMFSLDKETGDKIWNKVIADSNFQRN